MAKQTDTWEGTKALSDSSSTARRRTWRPHWHISHKEIVSTISMLKTITVGWNVLIWTLFDSNIFICLASIFSLKEKRKNRGKVLPFGNFTLKWSVFFIYFLIWNLFPFITWVRKNAGNQNQISFKLSLTSCWCTYILYLCKQIFFFFSGFWQTEGVVSCI